MDLISYERGCTFEVDVRSTIRKLPHKLVGPLINEARLPIFTVRGASIAIEINHPGPGTLVYRVTITLVQNLLLTSNQKFRFGLARAGQVRPKRTFGFEVNGRF